MSTILKALRRLEEERREQAGPDLREAVVARPGEPLAARARRGPWLALAAGAALGLAVKLAWPAFAPQASAPVAQEPAPQPTPAALPRPLMPPPPPPEPLAAVEPPPAPAPIALPSPAPRVEPAPAPRPRTAPRARAPAAPAAAAVEIALPTLPRVIVESTVWHPDAARRLARVRVEGRDEPLELREGDAVGPLIVTAIEPAGVVFRHGTVEHRRGVGEGR